MRRSSLLLAAILLLAAPAPALADRGAPAHGARPQTGPVLIPSGYLPVHHRAGGHGGRQVRPGGAPATRGPTSVRPARAPAPEAAREPTPPATGWLRRQLGLRAEVRDHAADVERLARGGDLSAAARTVERGARRLEPQGWRERRALRSALRTTLGTALDQAGRRSAAGDTVGARDALDALATLDAADLLGGFARWRAARATTGAGRNAVRAAGQAGKHGDLGLAHDNLALAADLRGAGDRRVVRAERRLHRQSLAHARRAARHGDHLHAMLALRSAADAAAAGGARFDERGAERILHRAFERALPRLVDQAGKLHRAGAHDDAATALLEARTIQQETGARPGFFARRKQERLERELAPRMRARASDR